MASQLPAGPPGPGAGTVPGPADRRTFFDEQRRHRRIAGFLSLLVGMSTVLMGVPLSALLFPFFFLLTSVLLDLISIAVPVPDLWGAFIGTGGHFAEGENAVREGAVIALVVCLPGMIAMVVLWAHITRTYMGSALEGFAARIGARRPSPEDLEERQLQNVVEEMAIAAGIDAPRVLVVDDPSANAAAIGSTIDRSALLVTRGVLDTCDRDETQAIAGHLVAMIANGDTRATTRLTSAFAAMGVVRKVLQVPLDLEVRQRVGELVAYIRRRGTTPDRRLEGDYLEWLLQEDELAEMEMGARTVLLLPFYMTLAMFNAVALMTTWLFLSPVLVPMLRSRRFLADATAIELNRYPAALRGGLGKLGSGRSRGFAIGGVPDLFFAVAPAAMDGRKESHPAFILALHPSLEKRQRRAQEIAERRVRGSLTEWIRAKAGPHGIAALVALVIGPLAATAAFLMLWLVVALTGLALLVGMMYASIAAALVNAILR
jgi:Zn-dependent protease with chaperone function